MDTYLKKVKLELQEVCTGIYSFKFGTELECKPRLLLI